MINPKPSCFAIKPGVAVKSDMVRHSSRTALWRSWGSLLSMIPCGGAAIWGNATFAPDLVDSAGVTIMMEVITPAQTSQHQLHHVDESTPIAPR